jgi:hypothetical protein
LPSDERQHSLGQVAGRKRHVLADAEHVEAIDEVVVRRVGAGVVDRALVIRTRQGIERPAFRHCWPVAAGPLSVPLHLPRSKLARCPLASTVQTTLLLSTSIPRGAKPVTFAFGVFHGTS